MPVLTHRLEQSLHLAERGPLLSALRRAQLKRIALQALTVVSMGSVLTGLIALRTAICLWRLHA